jgi:PAS domain S-box-containing protein
MNLAREMFFESHPIPMWIYDGDSLGILEVNSAAMASYGYTRDEFLRLTIADLRPAEDVPALVETVRANKPGLNHAGVWRHRRKSGEIIHVNVTSHSLEHNGRRARLVTAHDVTRLVALEREQAARLERERETRERAESAAERFRMLFEAAPGAFLVLSPGSWEIVAASDAYLDATMRRREDIVGRHLFDAFPPDPSDPDAEGVRSLRDSLLRVERSGEPDVMAVQRYPIPLPPEQGGGFVERYWSPVNTPTKAPDGSLRHIVHRVTDVTALVREANLPVGSEPRAISPPVSSLGEMLARTEELKAANVRLQTQDRYLRMAKRLLGIGIWSLDPATQSLQWSDNVYRMFGIERNGFGETWSAYLACVHADDRDLLQAALDAFLASGGQQFEFAHRAVRPDGAIVHVRGIAEIEDGPQGRRLSGVIQDMTRQFESESRIAKTLENISDAFFTLDTAWRFSFLNGQAERLLRRSRVALLGRKIWDEFPEALGTAFQQHYEQAARSGTTARFTAFFPPLDIWFEVSAYPSAEGLAVYFRDVSERKQAEEALRQSEERFRLIARATNDVIWDWDLRAGTVWWNEAMQSVFGHSPDSLEPGEASWLNRIHPGDRQRVSEGMNAAIAGNQATWRDEYRFLRADGREAVVIDRGFLMRDDSGKTVRMLGSMTDITERRELDERLRQSQRLEAIGQLTGGIAHDFNNLLTVIIGNSELLCDELADHPPRRMLAEMTGEAASRGAELTNRLLAFARRQPLEPRPLDVSRLVSGMDGLLRRTLAEDIEIEFVRGGGLWLAEVDGAQLESALLNLAINARDAMLDGGRLTIETANASLDDSYAAGHLDITPGQYVMISVSDTGVGMPSHVAERAFDPFFTTKAAGKGSGLGLSMVYGFVKQSGGHIKIYTEAGEGTTVRLYLPRARADARPAAAPGPVAEIVGGHEHILVVEDDGLVREHLISQLKGLGYRVSGAGSGKEALDMLARLPDVDLLFTDVVMPGGMNGRQLADAALRERPGLKVLFTCGYTENAIVHHGRLDRGVQLLSKPYRRQELAAKLRRVLDEPAPPAPA